MLADKKTPSPNTQAIPAAQWMKDIAPISVWVIGWMDQIRLGPKGMSMCPRSCLLEYAWLGTGHQLLENKFLYVLSYVLQIPRPHGRAIICIIKMK